MSRSKTKQEAHLPDDSQPFGTVLASHPCITPTSHSIRKGTPVKGNWQSSVIFAPCGTQTQRHLVGEKNLSFH